MSILCLALLSSSCKREYAVLNPAGPQSARIELLWWFFFWLCLAVFLITLAFLSIALFHPRYANSQVVGDRDDSRSRLAVSGAVLLTVLLLLGCLVASMFTGRTLYSLAAPESLTLEVTGQQWWWQVQYEAVMPSQRVTTANEIHIPTGQAICVKGFSQDVIHSFWVPNLHGKRDLIPGHETSIWIKADKPGSFWGQCAEFCGYQHAHMRILVVAESPADFRAWTEHQQTPAPPPTNVEQQRGQKVFLAAPCVMCHAIRGTPASGQVAPDLTHVASRSTFAAGTLSFNRQNLRDWILDPQRFKPGNRMPATTLADSDLQALLTYLESLQ